METINKVLIIAPHCDDEILGCGATISKLVRMGKEVYVAIMTIGYKRLSESDSGERDSPIRKEAKLAHEYLGVKKTFFFDFPAPRLDTFPSHIISDNISNVIREIKPDTLFIPGLGDLHVDHKVIYRACLVSARPMGNYSIKNILVYETLSETNWAPQMGGQQFIPNFFNKVEQIDIDNKLKSMAFFESQLKDFPHPRSLEAIKSLAKVRGSNVSYEFAEAFYVERIIYS